MKNYKLNTGRNVQQTNINRLTSIKVVVYDYLPTNQPPFYGHYIGQPALAGTSGEDDFVGAKFYCPHALADGNWCIRNRQKTLEFSSTVLSIDCLRTLYDYLKSTH